MRATSVWRRVLIPRWWWWWGARWSKDGASKVYGRQDSPEIKIELPPPGIPSLPSPSLMPTLDLFCLPVLHLWTSIMWLFEEKGKCSPCLPSRPRCSPFLFCPQQVMIQALCFHSQLNLLILNKPKLILTARNLKDWQFRLGRGRGGPNDDGSKMLMMMMPVIKTLTDKGSSSPVLLPRPGLQSRSRCFQAARLIILHQPVLRTTKSTSSSSPSSPMSSSRAPQVAWPSPIFLDP